MVEQRAVGVPRVDKPRSGMGTSDDGSVGVARAIRRMRDTRNVTLGPGLFSDPAWDMLLDLFVATETGSQLSITAACTGISASSATGLRYLKMLEDGGFVERRADPLDRRRTYLVLTGKARSVIFDLLTTLRRSLT